MTLPIPKQDAGHALNLILCNASAMASALQPWTHFVANTVYLNGISQLPQSESTVAGANYL